MSEPCSSKVTNEHRKNDANLLNKNFKLFSNNTKMKDFMNIYYSTNSNVEKYLSTSKEESPIRSYLTDTHRKNLGVNLTDNTNVSLDQMIIFANQNASDIKSMESNIKKRFGSTIKTKILKSTYMNLNFSKDLTTTGNVASNNYYPKVIESPLFSKIIFSPKISNANSVIQTETFNSNCIIQNLMDSIFDVKNRTIFFSNSHTNFALSKYKLYFESMKAEKHQIENYILEKIKELKFNNCFERSYSKTINKGLANQISLEITPMQIVFKQINSVKYISISIPLEIIPFIYCLDLNHIIQFLFFLIKIKDENSEDKIYLSKNGLKKALKNMKIFLISLDLCTELNLDKLKNDNHNEVVSFNWITSNSIYDISIEHPILNFSLDNKKIKARKILDKDFIMLFLVKNLDNWDYLAINYLVLIKKFRNLYNSFLSKSSKNTFIEAEQMLLNLDESTKSTTINQKMSDKSYCFNYSIFNTNYFIKLNGNTFEAHNTENMFSKENFEFSLRESIVLQRLTLNWKMKNLLRKIFTINKTTKKVIKDEQMLKKLEEKSLETKYYFINFNTENADILKIKDE